MDMPVDLAGRLTMVPAAAAGQSLRSTRTPLAPRVARGQPAARLPGLLSSVFSLCGGAHRVAAELAVGAARGQPVVPTVEQRERLRRETLGEHLRRWWLDLPRALQRDSAAEMPVLAQCPLWQPAVGIGDAVLLDWIETHVLAGHADAWLADWAEAPAEAARAWAAAGGSWPARALHAVRQRVGGAALPVAALPVPDPVDGTGVDGGDGWDEAARLDAAALGEPLWKGQPAETGPWTRLADPHAGQPSLYAPVWMRAAARVADVLRLAGPEGGQALSLGGRPLGPSAGLGWCEMARGLLVHVVQLDDRQHVADCRVIAPTDWNFHPQGTLARLVSAMAPGTAPERAQALAAAFDPCVPCTVGSGAPALGPTGGPHA